MLINSRLRNTVLQSKSVHVTELDDASKARAGSLREHRIYFFRAAREHAESRSRDMPSSFINASCRGGENNVEFT